MKRIGWLLCVLLLVACSGPAPSNPPRVESATRPTPRLGSQAPAPGSTTGCLEAPTSEIHGALYGAFTSHYVEIGRCAARIDSEPTLLSFRLPPSLSDADAHGALRLSGPSPVEPTLMRRSDELAIHLRLPAGRPGERFQLHLALPGRAPFGFDLERVETPRITAEVQQGDRSWEELRSGVTLPPGPLRLRFHLPPDIEIAEVHRRLAKAGDYPLARVDAETLQLTIAQPPTHLLFDLDHIPTADQLATRRSVWELFTGEPPRLVALDPATGSEEILGEVPANLTRTFPSPDGRFVALVGVDPQGLSTERLWVFDTATGVLLDTALRPSWPRAYIYWQSDGLVVALGAQVQRWDPTTAQTTVQTSEGSQFTAISPDGRFLAGITYDMTREDKDFLAPASIVLHEIATGEERLVAKGQIRVRIPHSEFAPSLPLRFTPDGEQLLIDEPVARTAQNDNWPFRRLQLDLATENLTELDEAGPTPPDDWIEGPAGYAYGLQFGFDLVVLKGADGKGQGHGNGLVVGWDAQGRLLLIRWTNFQELRHVWLGL